MVTFPVGFQTSSEAAVSIAVRPQKEANANDVVRMVDAIALKFLFIKNLLVMLLPDHGTMMTINCLYPETGKRTTV